MEKQKATERYDGDLIAEYMQYSVEQLCVAYTFDQIFEGSESPELELVIRANQSDFMSYLNEEMHKVNEKLKDE